MGRAPRVNGILMSKKVTINEEERARFSRILVVDDHPGQLKTILSLLHREGFETKGCMTATEALSYVEREEVDVAILDLRLPDLKGTRLLEQLRRKRSTIKGIIHTAFGSLSSAKDAMNLGAFAYVEKANDPRELIKQVYRAVRLHLDLYAGDLESAVAHRTALLEKSEEHYRFLVDNVSVGIHEIDLEGRILSMNRTGLKMLGKGDKAQVKGLPYLDLVAEKDRERLGGLLAKAFAGNSAEFEFSSPGDNGTNRVFFSHLIPIQDTEEKVYKLMGVTQEITERKQAEWAVLESEARLQAILDNTMAVIYLKDAQGRYLLINRRFEQVFNLQRDAVKGKTDYDLFPFGIADVFVKNDQTVLKTGKPMQLEEVAPHPDGLHTYISDKFPLHDSEGQPYALCGISTDITERKKMEDALRFTQFAVDCAGDAIFWAGPDKRFTYVNDEACRSLGYTREELLQMSIPEVSVNHDSQRYQWNIQQLREKQKIQYESVHRRKDGTFFPTEISLNLLPHDNREFTCGIIRDITERKEAEQKLQKAYDGLREVSRRLDNAEEAERKRIARELHDEFGQVLTVLKFDLAWIVRMVKGDFAALRETELIGKLQSMTDLTDKSIQTIRRIASSLRPPLLDDLGLIPALEWQTREFQVRTGITCNLFCPPTMNQVEIAQEHATALFRITQELLTNVMRHAQASCVNIEFKEEEGILILKVEDNGVGIKDDQGTHSLGLLGIRERVGILGGDFTILGEPGKGTTALVRYRRWEREPHEDKERSC